MRLADLGEVERLDRQRRVLMGLRENMNLTARLTTGAGLGSLTEELSAELIERLKPIVDADLADRIADIEIGMQILGVSVD